MIAINTGSAPFAPIGAEMPLRGRDHQTLRSAIADLYAVIAVLDSTQQSGFAGRLHALTLELRERVESQEKRSLS